MKQKQYERCVLILDKELKDQLKQLADSENRSLNNYLNLVLQKYTQKIVAGSKELIQET